MFPPSVIAQTLTEPTLTAPAPAGGLFCVRR